MTKAHTNIFGKNNGFVQVVDDKEKVSNACILLFGKYPQKFFPRVRMRFIRYEGVNEKVGTEINVIKDVTFEGTIQNKICRINQREYKKTSVSS